MQSLTDLPLIAAVNALPRLFGAKPKRKSSKRNLGTFPGAHARGPRKSLRNERPTFWDKFRKGEAPVREALLTLAGFFAIIALYGVIIGDGLTRIGEGVHAVVADATRAMGFNIVEVKVAGGSRLSNEEITSLLGIKASSALTFNVNAARARFLDVPWIKTASVRLTFPGTIEVNLVERAPYALWQKDGVVTMIDRDGRKIGPYSDARFSALPLVVGNGADEQSGPLLEELSRYPALQSRTRAAIYVANRRWNLKLADGVDVKLPEQNFDAALATLAKLDSDSALLNRDITIVDLRLPDRVIVRLSEGAAKSRADMLKTRSGSFKKSNVVTPPKPGGTQA